MILDRVEPALALTGKVEGPIPGMRDLRFRAIGQQPERRGAAERRHAEPVRDGCHVHLPAVAACGSDSRGSSRTDRKSTRLNSRHLVISYAVFCLQKKQR